MFYTKYRPQKFSEILRPNEAADALSKQVSTKKTVHAYLFIGPRGTGKTTTARILAKSLNCMNLGKNGDPCTECDICVAVKNGSFLDLIEIDAASNRGIDDIRDLKSKINLAPSHGKQKVYIIDEVHMLTKEAFNALLKTLEEPPKGVTFILCTTESSKVPDTIKSRCQIFHFKRARIKQLVEKLSFIAEKEGADITKKELEKVAQASLGGFRDAETLLQQILEGEISIDSFSDLETYEGYLRFVDYLWTQDVKNALDIVDNAFDEGLDLYVWVGELLRYLRDLLFVSSGVSEVLAIVPKELSERIIEQSGCIDKDWIVNAIEEFISSQTQVKDSFIPQLPIELAVVKLCNYGADAGGDMVAASTPEVPEGDNGGDSTDTGVDMSARGNTSKSGGRKDSHKKEESSADKKRTKGTESKDEDSGALAINLKEIKAGWPKFLEEVRKINHSLIAIMKHGTPVSVNGSVLVIEMCYSFHKERLETPKNSRLIDEALVGAYSKKIPVKYEVNKDRARKVQSGEANPLTDYNVVVPNKEDVAIDKDVIINTFDGELPMM